MKIVKKWKRRKPGVYAWRTERHHNRARREWGYVGESVNIAMRDRCHLGTCAHRPKVQHVGGGTVVSGRGCYAKPWTDLRPVRHTIIRLPWWLGFKWVLRPLETLVILALAPRYNWQKNAWNPRRVPPSTQAAQRAERNDAGPAYHAKVQAARALGIALRLAGVLLILAGLSGYLITRRGSLMIDIRSIFVTADDGEGAEIRCRKCPEWWADVDDLGLLTAIQRGSEHVRAEHRIHVGNCMCRGTQVTDQRCIPQAPRGVTV